MLKMAYQQIQGTHTNTNFGFSALILYNKKYCILVIHTVSECAKFIKNQIYIGML
jgi:hypothetical protein